MNSLKAILLKGSRHTVIIIIIIIIIMMIIIIIIIITQFLFEIITKN